MRPLTLLTLLACAHPADDTGGNASPFHTNKSSAESHSDMADRQAPTLQKAKWVEGEVVIGFVSSDLPNDLWINGTHLIRNQDIIGQAAATYLIEGDREVPDVVAALRGTPQVKYAEPNYLAEVYGVADPYYAYQWNLDLIDVEAAWVHSAGETAPIAIIDSGVSEGPTDGVNIYWGGYDFVDADWDPSDGFWHGSHVASIIGAPANSTGTIGIAYNAPIRSYRVCNSAGTCDLASTASAIGLADYEDVAVINISFGSTSYSTALANAVATAVGNGRAVVAATGKDGLGTLTYPAGLKDVVAVGSVDTTSTRTSTSNYGTSAYGGTVDLMAPGGDASVDLDGDGNVDGVLAESFRGGSWAYYLPSGTSFAAPQVAAAFALLMTVGANASEAEACLKIGAQASSPITGWDAEYGWGVLNVNAAMACYNAWELMDCGGTCSLGTWTVGGSDNFLTADQDGDGRDEIFAYNTGTRAYALKEYNGSAWTNLRSGTRAYSYQPVFGDFNGDGKDEELLRSSSGAYLGTLSGTTFSWSALAALSTWTPATSDKTTVGDFDGDGADELFIANASSARMLDYSASTRKWTSTKTWTTRLGTTWTFAAADRFFSGDFDGDGRDELIAANGSTVALYDDASSGWTRLFVSTSASGLSGAWTPSASDWITPGDIDGDGKTDLLITSATAAVLLTYNAGSWTRMWGETTGRFYWLTQSSSTDWLTGDWDADGLDEVMARSTSSGWNMRLHYLF